jgi:hypothetical protein
MSDFGSYLDEHGEGRRPSIGSHEDDKLMKAISRNEVYHSGKFPTIMFDSYLNNAFLIN